MKKEKTHCEFSLKLNKLFRNILNLKLHPQKKPLVQLHQGKLLFTKIYKLKNLISISGLIPKAVVIHVKGVIRVAKMTAKMSVKGKEVERGDLMLLTEAKGALKEMNVFKGPGVDLEVEIVAIIIVEDANYFKTGDGLAGASVLMLLVLIEPVKTMFVFIQLIFFM